MKTRLVHQSVHHETLIGVLANQPQWVLHVKILLHIHSSTESRGKSVYHGSRAQNVSC